ncbi:Holliday junction resolvase RuvX [Candidatus Entotheonella palauensis]|uniref:Putative pre-16S rRNA nuclease n=1 Tax=Candidatus Entotheonella gemina TaxID=1429439 RepID=W4MCD1_9BACT|nr:Holliday junction resolvase RuvX [Candidatus Entotheonella palauensis]ETX08014.1 MAG: Holliday junction resolvase [Candidatus Entotheonella gemina]
MRRLGLDLGDKRIGIAISDELGITAQGLQTLVRRNLQTDMAALQGLIDTHGVTEIVIGMPRNMDGSYGERAAVTEQFMEALEAACQLPCIPWDERLTSRQADRVLRAAGQHRRQPKSVRDRMAAQLILQSYMDYQRIRADRARSEL